MKNKIFLLLFLLISWAGIAVKAQNRNSAIQFKLRNNKLLTIVIDGRHYRRYGRSITFGDVPPGKHDIKVYRYYPNDDPRYDGYGTRARAVLVYKGRMYLDPATMYYCTIDPEYRTMSIRESRHIPYEINEETYPTGDAPNFLEDDEVEAQIEYNKQRNKKQSELQDPGLLSEQQLEELKLAVRQRSSNSEKTKLIEQYLGGKSLYTQQVSEIISWLSFENSKLQIAKYCYPLVKDPENYMRISNSLTFQSSKKELDQVMFQNKTTPKSASNNSSTKNLSDNALTSKQITELSGKVNELNTDTEKQKELYAYLESYRFPCAQLMQMMDWLTFEGSKLELVKWAFPRLSDPSELQQVKAKFNFVSSKKSIDELINKAKSGNNKNGSNR